ncbi:MAG: DNA-processing protein DprA, partial [Geminicoccaceae bacterium]
MHRTAPDSTLDWLQLARCEGVGPVTFARALERYRTLAGALAVVRREGRRVPDREELLAELDALAALGGRLVIGSDGDYPALLQPLPDRPPVLTVRGEVELLQRPAVAVVGARNASLNGRAFA